VRRGQSCDWYTERGTGHVIKTKLVTQVDALGITAVLTTDTDLKVRACSTSVLDRDIPQAPDTIGIYAGKRVVF